MDLVRSLVCWHMLDSLSPNCRLRPSACAKGEIVSIDAWRTCWCLNALSDLETRDGPALKAAAALGAVASIQVGCTFWDHTGSVMDSDMLESDILQHLPTDRVVLVYSW